MEGASADPEPLVAPRYYRGHSYWLNTTEAAEVLGVTPSRVRQLVRRGFLPVVMHAGHCYSRRQQVEVIANARESRKLR